MATLKDFIEPKKEITLLDLIDEEKKQPLKK